MNFEAVFKFLLKEFQKECVSFALIGGFALAPAGYVRSTDDIDFLVAKEDMPKVKKVMSANGYALLHESADVANFLNKELDFGRVDFLYAHRGRARKMLARAVEKDIFGGKFKVKVLLPEDLIGLKVQSSSNDPARFYQDMADIEALIRANAKSLDIPLLRGYFALFEREQDLEQILKRLKDADALQA